MANISKKPKSETARRKMRGRSTERKPRNLSVRRLSKEKKRKVTKRPRIPPDDRLEIALKFLREGRSQKRAAEIGMVPVKRFRRYLREHKLAKRKGNRWIITDRRIRQVVIISEAGEREIKVRGWDAASLVMRHRAAVTAFLDSNDATLLIPFEGWAVRDA